jgi:hypothetical protein
MLPRRFGSDPELVGPGHPDLTQPGPVVVGEPCPQPGGVLVMHRGFLDVFMVRTLSVALRSDRTEARPTQIFSGNGPLMKTVKETAGTA